ncbi:WASH complex subunit 3 [Periophthalmus magnuspinnatus]|uniref:WASH complex subunit 3 n=1 Tax=Periophthalmus magnuspinnatus TaxID=409849 RepID=A0A3B3ZFC4_9GOBI|nr:WASH complex subunit 3-like [Periophthalmus magnuspinnatus]XP_033845628.1 WASH complex subunit 3 [Periophthalmus magnuspinnatus]
MDEDGLPIVGSGVDLTKVPAIQQRRTIAFLNQFIVHTVRFLNRFSTVCEEKLANISLRVQQIETTLCILEAKLSSIPGLEDVTANEVRVRQNTNINGLPASHMQTENVESVPPTEAVQNEPDPPTAQKAEETISENVITVAKDPQYARYLKMVQVGVPVMAIKNKMVLEGLDPSLLDTPNAPLPGGASGSTDDQDVNSSDSESSFSD